MIIRYIEYEEKYKRRIVELLQKNLDKNFTEERFNWLHLESPMAPSNMLLAVTNDKVVGFRAVIKKTININGQKYIAGRDIDPTVDVNYRGQGIYSNLLKKSLIKFSEIDLYFNFANSLSKNGFLKNGWIGLEYDRVVHSISPKKSLSALFFASIYSSAHLIGFKNKTDVRKIIMRNYDFNSTAIKNEFPIYIKKDSEYLKWRFENSGKLYTCFKIGDDAIGYGLVVCKIKSNKCMVVEIINQSNLSNIDLLNNLFLYYKRIKQELIIYTWNQIAADVNSSMFTIPLKSKLPLYVRAGNNRKFDIDIFDIKNWYMPPSESEFI